MALKYKIYLDDLTCQCKASLFDTSKSCKHVKELLQAGVHRRPDHKFTVFKSGKNWLAGNADVGFVGETPKDVMDAITEVTRVNNVA